MTYLSSIYSLEIIMLANSKYPDRTPRNEMFDLGLHCLPMSNIRTVGGYRFIV